MEPGPVLEIVCLCFAFLCMILLFVMIFCTLCCGESDEEDNVVAGQRAARVAAYAPAMVELRPVPQDLAPVERRPPVAPAVKLGYFPYSMEGRRASEKLACAICLEVFVHEDICSEVPTCRHVFYRDCIDAWTKCNTTCPLCRVKC